MDARTLLEAMSPTGMTLARAQELLPHMERAMFAAGCTTVERAAMWCAQIGHESAGLRYMEEIASGDAYEWRKDLGNLYAGDGRRFKGSGPIQLTGRANFRAFTKWCRDNGHSDLDFEAHPNLVRDHPQWGFLAATYFWVTRPDLNRYADQKDLLRASAIINGWYNDGTGKPRKANGWADRQARYNRCLALGNRILPGKAKPVKVLHPMGEPSDVWRVSSGYGDRWGSFHAGLDFAAPLGTPIYAVADGIVIQGRDRSAGSVGGFGNWVWLDHQPTLGVDTIYGHMTHASILVRQGERVKAGQKIAEVGSEGGSTGPHLHFEVWGPPGRIGGKHMNPAPWLDKHLLNNKKEEEGLFMALSDKEQREILDYVRSSGPKIDRVFYELTHKFQSRYRDASGKLSDYRATLVGHILDDNRKLENFHADILPWLVKSTHDLKIAITSKEKKDD